MSEILNKEEKLQEDLSHYRNTLSYLGANVPIQVLCLPKAVEKCLAKSGCIRVYDLINRNLAEIEGLGVARINLLTSRLDEFFSIGL